MLTLLGRYAHMLNMINHVAPEITLTLLIDCLCKATGKGDNYSGDITLTFKQDGLRQPKIPAELKQQLMPPLRGIMKPLFARRQMKGFITLHIQNNKLSAIPEIVYGDDELLDGQEIYGYQVRRASIWKALVKNPDIPIQAILDAPHRFQSSAGMLEVTQDGYNSVKHKII